MMHDQKEKILLLGLSWIESNTFYLKYCFADLVRFVVI
uniref:Uncharacterized protein n=1 Tax=Rhizophora mucronata TaxID=61149 RepID=A0A2P2QCB3_RHIMU